MRKIEFRTLNFPKVLSVQLVSIVLLYLRNNIPDYINHIDGRITLKKKQAHSYLARIGIEPEPCTVPQGTINFLIVILTIIE